MPGGLHDTRHLLSLIWGPAFCWLLFTISIQISIQLAPVIQDSILCAVLCEIKIHHIRAKIIIYLCARS